jgi:very-short-patch-repair endonuclease/transposase
MRKVFLDDLPRYECGRYRGKINWGKCIESYVWFIYDNIKGNIQIIDYDKNYLYLKYQDQDAYKIKTQDFRNCMFGRLLNKRSSDFKIDVGATIKDEKRNLTIIDRKYIKDKHGENRKYYKYMCNVCKFKCNDYYRKGKYNKELWVPEYDLIHGQNCSCCEGRIVSKCINSVYITNVWMVKYFVNSEDAKKYTCQSNEKIKVKCLDCGTEKCMPVYKMYTNHSISCLCNDGKSYSEKAMFNVLKQLNLEFITEYNPDWIKPKRYDFYVPSMNLIIEMDGHFHSRNNKMNGQTKEESKFIDDKKDKLAKEHGIEVIRVDCDYEDINNRFKYIKNNIIYKLDKLFDLTSLDWIIIEKFALSNRIKEVCRIKSSYPNITIGEIKKITNLSDGTIRTYLIQGNKLGWCSYHGKSERNRSNKINAMKIAKKIVCLETEDIFESMLKCAKESEKIFSVKLDRASISRVCNGEYKHTKGFHFKYVSDLTPEERIKYDIDNKLQELQEEIK